MATSLGICCRGFFLTASVGGLVISDQTDMSPTGLGCVKTSAREEGAELFSLLSSPDSVASVFVCQIDEVETKFLSANSISEFSHSLGQSLHSQCPYDFRLSSDSEHIAASP